MLKIGRSKASRRGELRLRLKVLRLDLQQRMVVLMNDLRLE